MFLTILPIHAYVFVTAVGAQLVIDNIKDSHNYTEFEELHHKQEGKQVSVVLSTIGVQVSGQGGLIIKTLRVRMLVPFYLRIIFTFTLPEITLEIGSASANVITEDGKLPMNVKGSLTVGNTAIEGRMTVGTITKRLKNIDISLRIGTMKSTLVGYIGRLNITGLLDDIFMDILPQIINKSSTQTRLDKALEDLIMEFYKES